MPRTKAQNDLIREKTRSMILESSLELFADQGYNGTSMADIAKKAGISKGLAYSYFKSKQEILEKMIGEMMVNKFEVFNSLTSELKTPKTPFEKLMDILDNSFELITKDEKSLRLYIRFLLQPGILEDTQQTLKVYQGQIIEIWDVYNKIFSDLGFDDPKTEVFYFSALINGVCLEYLSHGKEFPLEKMKEKIRERYCNCSVQT